MFSGEDRYLCSDSPFIKVEETTSTPLTVYPFNLLDYSSVLFIERILNFKLNRLSTKVEKVIKSANKSSDITKGLFLTLMMR